MIYCKSDALKTLAIGDIVPVKRRRIFGWPWWTLIVAALTFAAFAIVAFRPVREPVLRAAGWALVASDPSGEDHEFVRRGLPYEDAAARQIRQGCLA